MCNVKSCLLAYVNEALPVDEDKIHTELKTCGVRTLSALRIFYLLRDFGVELMKLEIK